MTRSHRPIQYLPSFICNEGSYYDYKCSRFHYNIHTTHCQRAKRKRNSSRSKAEAPHVRVGLHKKEKVKVKGLPPNLKLNWDKSINMLAARGVKLINLTLWPLQGASVSRVTHTHLRHSPMSPQACGSTS